MDYFAVTGLHIRRNLELDKDSFSAFTIKIFHIDSLVLDTLSRISVHAIISS
jgi:hypothetical protein